jgi:hypothetical protein
VPPSLTDWNVSAENFLLASLNACRKGENGNEERDKKRLRERIRLGEWAKRLGLFFATSASYHS